MCLPPPVSGRLVIPADHPAFAGHFPGRPVLPGAVLLDLIVADAALAPLAGVVRLKFLRPVLPSETITYRLEPAAPDRVTITAACGAGVVLRGLLRLRGPRGQDGDGMTETP